MKIDLPDFTSERLITRALEARALAEKQKPASDFSPWVIKLQDLLIKEFFPSALTTAATKPAWNEFLHGAITGLLFAGGFQALGTTQADWEKMPFDKLLENLPPELRHEIAERLRAGTLLELPELKDATWKAMKKPDFSERQAFFEGLAIGNRAPTLMPLGTPANPTDATKIHFSLWLYWPELSAQPVSRARLAEALEKFFPENNERGPSWPERIRKIANRLGMPSPRNTRRDKPHGKLAN